MAMKKIEYGKYLLQYDASDHKKLTGVFTKESGEWKYYKGGNMEILREIAKKEKFEIQENWNTQQTISKLIDYLKEHNSLMDKFKRFF